MDIIANNHIIHNKQLAFVIAGQVTYILSRKVSQLHKSICSSQRVNLQILVNLEMRGINVKAVAIVRIFIWHQSYDKCRVLLAFLSWSCQVACSNNKSSRLLVLKSICQKRQTELVERRNVTRSFRGKSRRIFLDLTPLTRSTAGTQTVEFFGAINKRLVLV